MPHPLDDGGDDGDASTVHDSITEAESSRWASRSDEKHSRKNPLNANYPCLRLRLQFVLFAPFARGIQAISHAIAFSHRN